MNNDSSKRIMRRPEVEGATGYKTSRLYELVKLGQFPKPIRLGANRVGWLSEEVDQWLDARIAESRPHQAEA